MRNLPATTQDITLASQDNSSTGSKHFHSAESNPNENSIKTYLSVLRRRKWYVICSLLIALPILIINSELEERIYESSVRILIEDSNERILNIQEVLGQDSSENFYLTEYQIIRSEENIADVVDKLKLDKKVSIEKYGIVKRISEIGYSVKNHVFSLKKNIINYISTQVLGIKDGENTQPEVLHDPAELRRRAAIEELSKSLQIVTKPGGKLVDIIISGTSPHEITQQANTLAEIYLHKNLGEKIEATTNAITWLTQQTAELKKQMYNAELKLQEFREKANVISFDSEEKNNIVLARLSTLHNEYERTNANRIDIENRLKNIIDLSKNNIYNIENIPHHSNRSIDSIILELRKKYFDLQSQYKILSTTYKEMHPLVVEIKTRMKSIKELIKDELQKSIYSLRDEYKIVQEKEKSLKKELDVQQKRTLNLKNDMITYTALRREAESYRDLYDTAAERLREIQLTQASITNNVKIVNRASVPLQPVPGHTTIKMLAGILLSCCCGIGLAFIREFFDNRFKEANQVESYLRVPVLGTIPHYRPQKGRRAEDPILLSDSFSPTSEAYRIIRTRIQAATPIAKTLLVTSAVAFEGKSTTTANIGISFARMGRSVLLVDTDLRRPSLHRRFRLSATEGFANVLTGQADWKQVVQHTSIPNLKVLPTGFHTHNPSDLLSLMHMRRLIASLKNAFDLVIFDAPLVLSVPDVEIITPYMDGVILVHAPHRCSREDVLDAKTILERVGSNILGIVLNNIKRKYLKYYDRHDYYYTYGNTYTTTQTKLLSQ